MSAARKPLVLGSSGQQQELQSGDALLLQAATTANASINLPHGMAPASPTDGDVWTTTEGLFVQVDGVTGAFFVPSTVPAQPTFAFAVTGGP